MNIFELDKKKPIIKDAGVNEGYVNKYGSQIRDLRDQLDKREFKYDIDSDELYNTYRDNYIRQGKLAAEDMMGKATALTGGYANTYAQTVGQQVYQGYIEDANNAIPDFYKVALDRYVAEGNELADRYDRLIDAEEKDYSRYQTEKAQEFDNYLKTLSLMSDLSEQGKDDGEPEAPITWKQTGLTDDNGNPIWITSEGKTQAFGIGYNPYTGTINPDSKNTLVGVHVQKNTFENGYQPDNVNGVKLEKTGATELETGAPIYKSADGKYYIWRDDLNQYEQVEPIA